MKRQARLAVSALALTCATLGCVPALDPPGLDSKLALSAWIEEGDLVALIASTRATRHRLTLAYIPLEVAVVNRGMKSLTLTRESFTIGDGHGRRYPLAGIKEILDGYKGSVDTDRRQFVEIEPIVRSKYASYTRVPSNFSPGFSDAIARDRVALPRYAFMCDFLYFPTPEGYEPDEPLELQITSPELESPIFVRFTVPA